VYNIDVEALADLSLAALGYGSSLRWQTIGDLSPSRLWESRLLYAYIAPSWHWTHPAQLCLKLNTTHYDLIPISSKLKIFELKQILVLVLDHVRVDYRSDRCQSIFVDRHWSNNTIFTIFWVLEWTVKYAAIWQTNTLYTQCTQHSIIPSWLRCGIVYVPSMTHHCPSTSACWIYESSIVGS